MKDFRNFPCDVRISSSETPSEIDQLHIQVPGLQNLSNVTAAIAACRINNISFLKIKLFFLFRKYYYSSIPLLGPMTDIMNDRYILPQNEIIFFYFETITASFKYLSSIFQALFKFTSTFHSTDFSSNFF